MTAPKKVRMVRCTYVRENDGWIPMGRARTRCPGCGAVVGPGTTHPVKMFTPTRDERSDT